MMLRMRKVYVTLGSRAVSKIDSLVKQGVFSSRSDAVQSALREKLDRLAVDRFVRECAKLDPVEERSMAEEGLFARVARVGSRW